MDRGFRERVGNVRGFFDSHWANGFTGTIAQLVCYIDRRDRILVSQLANSRQHGVDPSPAHEFVVGDSETTNL